MTEDKSALRRRVLDARGQLGVSEVAAASRSLCQRLTSLPELAGAALVAGYGSFRNEIDPALALDAARTRGAAIAMPRMLPGAGARLALHLHEAGVTLQPSRLGIPEPPPDAPPVDGEAVEVVLVPAVAVDACGGRLGYGGGYYDRLLQQLPHAVRVAVVHELQFVEAVPTEAHDVPMHWVISDRRTLRIGPS